MKIKTTDLIGPALDWAVGIAGHPSSAKLLWRLMTTGNWKPSTDWAQGGPIIEREEINLEIHSDGHTRASFYRMRLTHDGRAKHYHHQHGPTPLVAAMRCYCYSKLGDEVEIPKELL